MKNGIHSFPASGLAHKGQREEQVGKLACCVLGQGTQRDAFIALWKTGGGAEQSTRRGGPVGRKTYKQSMSLYA